MTPQETETRIQELARQIAFANGLGVRADICNDPEQKAEAARLHEEATDELRAIEAARQPPSEDAPK